MSTMDAQAGAIRTDSAFAAKVLAANDDNSTGAIPLGFSINYFGTTYNSVYVNNNGNITFAGPLSSYTPFGLTSTNTPIVAPFFADVDTRGAGSSPVRYGQSFGVGLVNGRPAFGANWVDVGYYSAKFDKLNSFQVVLVDRSDTGTGNFDIELNYDKIQWETGDASNGVNGLGGSSARAGFSAGSGASGTFFELPGSGVPGSFLDSNTATGLIYTSRNTNIAGRFSFQARNGSVTAVNSVSDASTSEGNSGTKTLDFLVSLDAPASADAVVTYSTADGTATAAGNDYVAVTNGTITIPTNRTTGTISITVNGDTVPEADENFTVNISGVTNGTVRNGQGTGTIQNDDEVPSLIVNTTSDVTAFDGQNSLREAISFANSHPNGALPDEIKFASPLFNSAQTISLTSALPNLTDAVIITGTGANLLTVKATTQGEFAIFSVNDGSGPVNNGVTFKLSGISVSNGSAGIYNNNGGPMTLSNCTVSGNTNNGIANNGSATLSNCTLSGNGTGINNPGGTVMVGNSISAGNTTDASGAFTSSGYNLIGDVKTATGFTNGTNGDKVGGGANPVIDAKLSPLVINNGGPTATMALLAGGPAINGGSNALIATDILDADGDGNTTEPAPFDQRGTGYARIQGSTVDIGAYESNFLPPTVSIGNVSIAEGNSGTTNFVFPVTLSGASASDVTVAYAVSGTTATSGGDYGTAFDSDGATPGTLKITAGAMSGTITVPVVGDTLYEGNESFTVTLSSPTNATFGASTVGNGTIQNDDVAPPSSVILSEFRLSGPGGASDEFIELANVSAVPVALSGYTVSSSDGVLASLSLSGKSIPAGGHLLLTNSGGYSLGVTGDVVYTGNIASNAVLTLRNAGGAVADFAGNLGVSPSSAGNEHAFVRRLEKGLPLRVGTGTDSSDFNLVDTSATLSTSDGSGVGPLTAARLGAPGPQNTSSPLQRNDKITFLPTNISGVNADGRYASKGSALDPFGRLTLRRTITNNTGAPVTALRFRIVAITGGTSTASGVADLRALTSAGVTVNSVKVVQGITLDAPSTPTTPPPSFGPGVVGNGGGLNSSWTAVTIPGGSLGNGQSISVEFLFGLVQAGNYRVVIDTELLP